MRASLIFSSHHGEGPTHHLLCIGDFRQQGGHGEEIQSVGNSSRLIPLLSFHIWWCWLWLESSSAHSRQCWPVWSGFQPILEEQNNFLCLYHHLRWNTTKRTNISWWQSAFISRPLPHLSWTQIDVCGSYFCHFRFIIDASMWNMSLFYVFDQFVPDFRTWFYFHIRVAAKKKQRRS